MQLEPNLVQYQQWTTTSSWPLNQQQLQLLPVYVQPAGHEPTVDGQPPHSEAPLQQYRFAPATSGRYAPASKPKPTPAMTFPVRPRNRLLEVRSSIQPAILSVISPLSRAGPPREKAADPSPRLQAQ